MSIVATVAHLSYCWALVAQLMESVVGHIGASWRTRLKLCTLAPWRIRLNMCFLGPTQTQTTNRSVQPLLHSSRQKVPIFTMGVPFIQNWAFLLGDLDPHIIRDSMGQPKPTTQTSSRSVQPLLHRWQWDTPFPSQNCSFPSGDLDPHLICGSLGPPESSIQTASRSVQPCLYGSLVWQTDRPTDHATRSVT